MTTLLPVPSRDPNFIATPEFELLVAISGKMLADGRTANTLLLGPAGCGKTASAEQLAAYLNLPYLHLNCSNIREASMLFGTREVKDGRTFTRPSLFTQTIEAGSAVVMLDEINRCAPTALNGLLTAMDGSSPYSEDLERHVKVGEKVIFIGACNIGAAYTGTFRLDKALDDRFARRLEVSYLPEEKEVELLTRATGIGQEAGKRLVQIANQVRGEYNKGTRKFSQDISTRVLLGAARDFAVLEGVRKGAGPKSLQFTIVNRFDAGGDSNSERTQLGMLVDGKFGSWTGEEEEDAAKEKAAAATAKKESKGKSSDDVDNTTKAPKTGNTDGEGPDVKVEF